MSYILEALKKAEHQREIGQVPRIDSEHEAIAAAPASRWVVIGVLVLLVNAGLLLALFWPGDAENVTVLPVSTPPPPPHASSEMPVARTNASLTGPAGEAPVLSSPDAIVPPARQPVRSAPAARAEPAMPRRDVEVAPPVAAPVLPVPRPEPIAMPAPAPRALNLPVWPQVPTAVFQGLKGNLRLDVHVYSPRASERFVLINLQKYHEGEQLQEGAVVDEITPEGVVLSLRGQQFLLRAQ